MNLDHIVILVTDLDRSMPFYEAFLPLIGFSKSRDHIFGNDQGIYFDFRLAQEPEHGYHRYGPGLNHLGFTATSVDELEAIQRTMRERGFEMPEIQTIDGAKALFVKDPDGMRVELTVYP
ncbi:MAG: VOC family protein [Wenzhouxiangellaceae bacterium]